MRFDIRFLIPFLVIAATMMGLSARAAVVSITWDDLIPPPGLGKKFERGQSTKVAGMVGLNEFDGNEEEYKMFLDDIKIMRDMQPEDAEINVLLHNTLVKIAGYVTPVGFDEDTVTEFLFVPYMGACIHVPPPPANQIIYVSGAKGLTIDQIYEPVWLTGKLQAKSVTTVLADVGYSVKGAQIEPYTE